ncbi:MAG: hypothetical protein QNK20_06660 [Aureibaculum sp.]|nr:hypothetical protein [Aureibaculum sp.]
MITKFCEAEYMRLKKIQNYQYLLPNHYKKVGIALLIASLAALITRKYLFEDVELVQEIGRKGMLLALLLITLSKEKIEDELITKLRGQAFAVAFIAGVIYTLVQPLINYLVALLIKPENATYSDLGDFIVMWFMLVIYLSFFYMFKRYR